ncbi:MAG: DUF3604 domain-containing protein [Armatimonadota bacterium]|nr:DUF3604 domain-containing protein [Armatimonadota bacterium]
MTQERPQLPEVIERLIDPQVASLRVVTDSSAAAGSRVAVTVQARNATGATATAGEGSVPLVLRGPGGHAKAGEVELSGGLGHAEIELPEPGVYRVEALMSEELWAVSDPVEVADREPQRRLYWGDIHSHIRERRAQATISDADELMGPATVDAALAWARDVAGVHFASVTDHDLKLTELEWEETIAACDEVTEDGRFVAFPGYEWGDSRGMAMNYGHRQVVYRSGEIAGGEQVPLLRCCEQPTHTAPGLYAGLREAVSLEDVLVVPHHTARGGGNTWMNWDYFDPELERCCEIYSIWGSSEMMGEPYPIRYIATGGYFGTAEARGHHLQDGLARGCRFGFTGGSESHDGRPARPLIHGRELIAESDQLWPPGITGVWAERLSRDAVFDALRARRCYGTTGARIIVRFSLGDAAMGEEVAAEQLSAPVELTAEAIGTAAIRRCELVRSNQVIDAASSGNEHLTAQFMDGSRPHPGDFYYLRITQADGEMAWASPIFIT